MVCNSIIFATLVTEPLVKARWKNLRDAYRKLVRKTMRTGQPPRWPYFKSMNFLTLTDVPRDSGTKQGQKIEDISNDADYTTNSDDDPLSLTAQSLKMEKDIKRNSEELPRHFLEVESERASLSLNEQQQQQTVSADDEDYQFLLSLYPHIKQVPLNRKLPLRMKIEQVIYEELYSLPSTSNSTKSIIASYQTE